MATTHKTCRECNGAGGEDVYHSSGDPQRDTFANCAECGGSGQIRFAPVDALIALNAQRAATLRIARRLGASPQLQQFSRENYARIRAAAVSPVLLP